MLNESPEPKTPDHRLSMPSIEIYGHSVTCMAIYEYADTHGYPMMSNDGAANPEDQGWRLFQTSENLIAHHFNNIH